MITESTITKYVIWDRDNSAFYSNYDNVLSKLKLTSNIHSATFFLTKSQAVDVMLPMFGCVPLLYDAQGIRVYIEAKPCNNLEFKPVEISIKY